MNIRLIATKEDHNEAMTEINRLWNSPLGSPERARLELLAMLVHHYEREREPISENDPIEAIKFRMEQQGLARKDLLGIFGTSARASEVLSGKRSLTLNMIRKLHAELGIPLESLVMSPTPRSPKQTRHKRRTTRAA